MDGFFAYIDQTLYPSLQVNGNHSNSIAPIAEVIGCYPISSDSEEIESFISNTSVEPPWPFSNPEDSYRTRTTPSPVIEQVEDSTISCSTEPHEKKRGNANPTTPKGKSKGSLKPSRGNNTTGRVGKLLCSQCRYWKVKCVYDDVESSCQNCRRKGLECSRKLSARIWKLENPSHQSPKRNTRRPKSQFDRNNQIMTQLVRRPLPLYELVDSFEAMRIQFLRETEGLFRFANLQLLRTDERRLWENVFSRFGPTLSGPVRHGYILYSLYKDENGFNDDHHECDQLQRFYHSTRAAINGNDVASLVYGCYAVCMYSLRTGRDFEEAQTHARGFLTSISRFLASQYIENEEVFLLECMAEKMLWVGAQTFFFKANWLTSDLTEVTEFLGSLFYTETPKGDEPRWIQESSSEVSLKLKFVKTLVQVYRRRFRFNDPESFKDSLVSRFSRDFATPIESQYRDITWYFNIVHLRPLSRNLWSRLLDAVLDLACNSDLDETLDQRTMTTILDMYSIIDLIPDPPDTKDVSAELESLLDVASYCLVFVSVMLNENTSAESQISSSRFTSPLMS